MQYAQDYDEKFVLAVIGGPSPGTPIGWADAIQPYLKSTQIYQCPSDSIGPSDNLTATGAAGTYTDYWYNSMLSLQSGSSNCNYGVSIATLEYPTLTVMNGDGSASNGMAAYRTNGNGTGNSLTVNSPTYFSMAAGLVGTGSVVNRHLDGANLLYSDGHVKWLKTNDSTTSVKGNIYNGKVKFDFSGQAPTFHVSDQVTP